MNTGLTFLATCIKNAHEKSLFKTPTLAPSLRASFIGAAIQPCLLVNFFLGLLHGHATRNDGVHK